LFSWFICSCLILIPAQLFEFRYLTNSYIVLVILCSKYMNDNENNDTFDNIFNFISNYMVNISNLVFMILINCAVLFIFIFKPFVNSFMNNEISRFMW